MTKQVPAVSGRGVRAIAVLSALALMALATVASAQSPKEARAAANAALGKGDFAAAIESLELLISQLGESKQKAIIQSLEVIYYKLGIAYFFTGGFSESEKAFEAYQKKYPKGTWVPEANLYIADGLRFAGQNDKAMKKYEECLKKFGPRYDIDLRTDIQCSMVRLLILKDDWKAPQALLAEIYARAPDSGRRNWAATLWTIAYLKEREVDKVYRLVPLLLQPNSFASRSVALNMAALEAGDELFAEEQYRDALWLYRLVYPRDVLVLNMERHLRALQRRSEQLKKRGDKLRELMRLQERIGEAENEIAALEKIDNYDTELSSRMARAYLETSRYREAREMFLYLHQETDGDLADESLYLAFRCSLHVPPMERALELGNEYMLKYPSGQYFDPLTLAMGQVYAQRQDWPEVIRHFNETLRINPEHEDGAECRFLLAYAHFMEEQFAETVRHLREMMAKYPDNPRREDGTYWLGMALLYDKKYEESAVDFDTLLTDFPDTLYREDASYRRGVCDYGVSDYANAEVRLSRFAAEYPQSKLIGEAQMMLADIAANAGGDRLRDACRLYQMAMDDQNLNVELYNYCAFRCGEILYDDYKDYPATIRHFESYMARNREESNIPQAIFFVGRSLWNQDEKLGALTRYRQAVQDYGEDIAAIGVDLILEEWIGKARGGEENIREQAWRDLRDAIKQAKSKSQPVLALRLKRALLYESNVSEQTIEQRRQESVAIRNEVVADVDEMDRATRLKRKELEIEEERRQLAERQQILDEIVREDNIPIAGPSALELILDEAVKRHDTELAKKAANQIIKVFTETDYALSARMFLAQQAFDEADYPTAIRHLNVIREVFATDLQAAHALALLGDIYLDMKEGDKADDCFKKILAVREWRGELWPRALYGRALAALMGRKYDQAVANLERIYLLYGNYRQWTAKAYLLRAQTLVRMSQYRQAKEVLDEMLGNAELADYPEFEQAQKEIETLRRRI
jgi:tetratricopeptide (TPR) repeat protein